MTRIQLKSENVLNEMAEKKKNDACEEKDLKKIQSQIEEVEQVERELKFVCGERFKARLENVKRIQWLTKSKTKTEENIEK